MRNIPCVANNEKIEQTVPDIYKVNVVMIYVGWTGTFIQYMHSHNHIVCYIQHLYGTQLTDYTKHALEKGKKS